MAKKEFKFRGKSLEELQTMSISEFMLLVDSATRRKLKRGFTESEKIFLKKVRAGKKNIETHCRDMVILPEMVGMIIKVHNGKAFNDIEIAPEMVGHRLGEFSLTRSRVGHSAPGVGATRSSSALSVR